MNDVAWVLGREVNRVIGWADWAHVIEQPTRSQSVRVAVAIHNVRYQLYIVERCPFASWRNTP